MKHFRTFFALMLALAMLAATGAGALAEIAMTKRDMAVNRELAKDATNILVLLQDGERTDTVMIASINSRTGRAVMARVDEGLTLEVTDNAGASAEAALCDVYAMGDARSKGLLVCRELNELLDLNLTTYVALDIARLPELVEYVDWVYFELSEAEAAALAMPVGGNDFFADTVMDYVRLQLEGDDLAVSRAYNAVMQLLYQGLHRSGLGDLMGLGKKLLDSMDTNLGVLQAVTLVSAVQAGEDRRELYLTGEAGDMRAALHGAIYE